MNLDPEVSSHGGRRVGAQVLRHSDQSCANDLEIVTPSAVNLYPALESTGPIQTKQCKVRPRTDVLFLDRTRRNDHKNWHLNSQQENAIFVVERVADKVIVPTLTRAEPGPWEQEFKAETTYVSILNILEWLA